MRRRERRQPSATAGYPLRGHAAWQSIGPAPPAINVPVVADPASRTIYIGSFGGGMFKSIDAAETWFPISSGLDDKSMTGLAMDPDAPDTVYAATFYRSVYKTVTGGR